MARMPGERCKRPFHEGYLAAAAAPYLVPGSVPWCPYSNGSPAHLVWLEGYEAWTLDLLTALRKSV